MSEHLDSPPRSESGSAAPMFRLRHESLTVHIATYLRSLVLAGQIAPGGYIRIAEIAHSLNTSSTPVREALCGLQGEGLVKLVPRRGFRVEQFNIQDVQDMFFVQAAVAGELASRAATQADATDTTALDALQARMDSAAAAGAYGELEELNHHFHRTINKSAMAPKLTSILDLAARYVPSHFYASIPGWPEASIGDHSAIVSAIKGAAPDAARQAMAQHIRHAGDLLVVHLNALRHQNLQSPEQRGDSRDPFGPTGGVADRDGLKMYGLYHVPSGISSQEDLSQGSSSRTHRAGSHDAGDID